MKKIAAVFSKIYDALHHPSDDIKTLYLLILVVLGFIVNAWIATVEKTSFFLFLYCGILFLLYKFGYKLKRRTIVTIIIIELICTYLLTILALPELLHLKI